MNAPDKGQTRVLICGATGYLGRYLVQCAHDRGHWVRALVRRPEGLGEARQACDDVFVGQATQPETLAGLCDGIDVVGVIRDTKLALYDGIGTADINKAVVMAMRARIERDPVYSTLAARFLYNDLYKQVVGIDA